MIEHIRVDEAISKRLADNFNVSSKKAVATFEFISADGFIFLCNGIRVSENDNAIDDMHKMFNAIGLDRNKVIAGGIYSLKVTAKYGKLVDIEAKFLPYREDND